MFRSAASPLNTVVRRDYLPGYLSGTVCVLTNATIFLATMVVAFFASLSIGTNHALASSLAIGLVCAVALSALDIVIVVYRRQRFTKRFLSELTPEGRDIVALMSQLLAHTEDAGFGDHYLEAKKLLDYDRRISSQPPTNAAEELARLSQIVHTRDEAMDR